VGKAGPSAASDAGPWESLWTRTKAGERIDAELHYLAEHGVKIQFLHEGVMAYGRRWTRRAQAIQEAEESSPGLKRLVGPPFPKNREVLSRQSGTQ